MLGVDVVATGNDGKQGVDMFRLTGPDIVFLDLSMPVYDGYYALEKIRFLDDRAFVVILTASDYDQVAERTRHCKPNSIIIKPCNTNKIRKIIETKRSEMRASVPLR